MELGNILANLCGIELEEILETLIDKGIGLAIMQLLANGLEMSCNAILYQGLEALGNLVNVFQDDDLASKLQAQLNLFSQDGMSSYDILESIACEATT